MRIKFNTNKYRVFLPKKIDAVYVRPIAGRPIKLVHDEEIIVKDSNEDTVKIKAENWLSFLSREEFDKLKTHLKEVF